MNKSEVVKSQRTQTFRISISVQHHRPPSVPSSPAIVPLMLKQQLHQLRSVPSVGYLRKFSSDPDMAATATI